MDFGGDAAAVAAATAAAGMEITHVLAHANISAPAIQAGPTKLFVGSIPPGTTKDVLTEEFSKLGQVAEVFLKQDAADPARMWGFVTYSSPEGAALAVATLNEKMSFPNAVRPLSVSYARSSGNSGGGGQVSAPPSMPASLPGMPSVGPTKLFIGSIPAGTTKELIKSELEKFGPLTDVFLKSDNSEQGRMWGFVTYMEAGSASAAVSALHERLMLPGGSRACAVSFAKNSQQQHSMAAASLAGQNPPTTKLFLGTIPAGTTEALLRTEFERFGQVTEVFLRNDNSDSTRMWGFLTYADAQSSAMAVSTLHEKLMLPGSVRPIAVSFAKNSGPAAAPGGAQQSLGNAIAAAAMTLGAAGMPGMVDHGWKTYYNADGIPYYHHATTNRTQWDMPAEMTAAQAGAMPGAGNFAAALGLQAAAANPYGAYGAMTAPGIGLTQQYTPY